MLGLICYAVLCVNSSFSIISLGRKSWLISLFLSSWCHVAVIVPCLFLMVPRVGMQCMFVTFPCHTHTHAIIQLLVVVVFMLCSEKMPYYLTAIFSAKLFLLEVIIYFHD